MRGLLGAFVVAGLPAVALGATLQVDDDRAQCPDAAFTSIQAAVDAAASGDVVSVCPGRYAEAVTVRRTLRLEGAGPAPRLRRADATTEALVISSGAPAFLLAADGVHVEGFTLQPEIPHTDVGVRSASPSTGHAVVGNAILEFGTGLELTNADAGRPARVERNLVRSVSRGMELSGEGVQVEDNRVEDVTGAGVVISRAAGVVLERNRVQGGLGPAIQVDATTDSALVRNRVEGAGRDGIVLIASKRLVVEENVLVGLPRGSGLVARAVGSSRLVGNQVSRVGCALEPKEAVLLLDSTDVAVERNRVEGTQGWGIRLTSSSFNQVEGNEVRASTRDGVRVDAGSQGNTLRGNRLQGNAEHDAHDEAAGDNTWSLNRCRTGAAPHDARAALCH